MSDSPDLRGRNAERASPEALSESRHISAIGPHFRSPSRDRPPPQVDHAGSHKHGTDADGGQVHEEHVERPPQQVEDREAREKEAHQGDRAPAGRQVAPPIDEAHVGRQREHEHVVPALRRQQGNQT